jgi:hypothetical protein
MMHVPMENAGRGSGVATWNLRREVSVVQSVH